MQQDTLRQRKGKDVSDNIVTKDEPEHKEAKAKTSRLAKPPISWDIWLSITFTLVISLAIVVYIEGRPPDVTADKNSPFDTESVLRVRRDMTDITDLGCRTVGSKANEELAVDMIVSKLSKIQAEAHEHVIFEIAKQSVSGAFNMDFLGGATNVYQDVTNVMCR
jgi:hypothetical protein